MRGGAGRGGEAEREEEREEAARSVRGEEGGGARHIRARWRGARRCKDWMESGLAPPTRGGLLAGCRLEVGAGCGGRGEWSAWVLLGLGEAGLVGQRARHVACLELFRP